MVMEIGVLGPVELRDDAGRAAPVAGARLRALVILLALEAGRFVSADRLIDGVWGAELPAAAGNALQALVSRLRRAGLVVEAAAAGYRLVIDRDRIDAYRFEELPAGEALALWRGPLEFPAAAQAAAARLEELRLAKVQQRIAGDLERGADVVPELQQLTAAHPLHEPLAALLMRALVAAGRPGTALEVFEQTRRALADELGADPSPALAELHVELLRAARPPARGNLPAEVSSFVGRDGDVRAVTALLARHRLVTLTGPGGTGKTRLSVEVGHAGTGTGSNEAVWRVELAPVTDPGEIAQAVLSALGLRSQVVVGRADEPAEPMVRLREALAGRQLLLILDNCEHLIAAAAALADDLLRSAPGLRLLATSREPLGISGEQLWPVEPLESPPDGADPAAYPAVRLLLDRAAAARPGFALTAATTGPVVRICRALDGMPLAIELAAARLRTLPVDVLAERLADRFALLNGGSRTAMPRHQTLRAVVDWSWDLLSEPERRLWRRFALFHGGATVEAVEQVCGADLDLLAALVDKSLLVLDGGTGRYRMLETIREYGLERLAQAGESEPARLALARYLLELAGTADPLLRGRDQLRWLAALTAEQDNLHASVRAAIEAGDGATAVAFTARLSWYWWLSGHRAEGAALAREAVALPGADDPSDRAVTYACGALNGLDGASAFEEVEAAFEAAAELSDRGIAGTHPVLHLLGPLAAIFRIGWRVAGIDKLDPLFSDPDPWVRALAKFFSAQLRLNLGQSSDLAAADMRTALAGFRAIGERWGIGFTLSQLGDLASAQGDFATAVKWQREAIALVREVGIQEDMPQLEVKFAHQLWLAGERAEAHRMLAQARRSAERIGYGEVPATVEYGHAVIAAEEGELDEARRRLATVIELIDQARISPQFRAVTHTAQGLIEGAAGDLVSARDFHALAIGLAIQTADSPVIARTLVGAADYVLRCGDPARAALLLGAADTVRGSVDRSMTDGARVGAEARAALGDAGFEAAYRAGAAVTVATAAEATGIAISA
jgi:predicted ATPase/DNA-binding SARP family transcriptional activator